jgi:hypothetical protein
MFSNPTNIAVDSRGRVWVCEAYNYRNALNPKNPVKKEGDRIMILEDTDGDGKADKSKIFYQGTDVNAALGICVLGNKVFVSCSPNVFVFTDANGDDVPDKKEILFKGIHGEQHDHGMHTFTLVMMDVCILTWAMKEDSVGCCRRYGHRYPWPESSSTMENLFIRDLRLRCELDGSKVLKYWVITSETTMS